MTQAQTPGASRSAPRPPSSGGSVGSAGGLSRVGGAFRSVGSRGASYITASQGRQTAFLLIVAIFLARLVLTNQLQTFWSAMWGQSRPLGAALPRNVAAANSAAAQQANQQGQQGQQQTTNTSAGVAQGAAAGLGAALKRIFGR